ncbi:HNH endonuclease signature motif containing protein, partial [Streptomyces hydrogenans]|uniref:HNH endonuclease signature motif containing protein n=1 Tax=Streptomyces hydrogenans TaxID=1873719 RepID=UPI0036A8141E
TTATAPSGHLHGDPGDAATRSGDHTQTGSDDTTGDHGSDATTGDHGGDANTAAANGHSHCQPGDSADHGNEHPDQGSNHTACGSDDDRVNSSKASPSTEPDSADGDPNGPGTTLPAGSRSRTGIPGTGSFIFTGPVNASTVRKIACDADIIPVLLGSEGRILDIGRTTRIFPPHIRKAITARDQGCTFPGCTMPAPWCEAHHITYWSHGGTTSTDNGTLLCSHHHHLIHLCGHRHRWIYAEPATMPRPRPVLASQQGRGSA